MIQSLPKNYGFLNFYFYGTKGRFLIKNAGYTVQLCKLIENKNYKNYFELSKPVIETGKIRSFMAPMADHLVRCLDGLEEPLNTGEDGLAALKVVEALRKSAENDGKTIKIT
jgi:predicted dehydrogenase